MNQTEPAASLYQALIEQAPDSIALIAADTFQVIECNEAFCQLLGYDSRAEARQLTADDFLAFDPEAWQEMATSLLIRKQVIQGEANYRRRDQSLVPVNLSLSYFSHQQQSAFCLIAKGDSERRKVKADLTRLAMVAEKTSNSVIICDVARKIEWVNHGFTVMTGYALAEVIGCVPGEILYGEKTDPVAVQVIEQTLANGQPVEGEVFNYHKSGRGFWAYYSITPIYDEAGEHQGFIGVGSDVTEQKELLASLQQSREHYRALTEAAPDIIITISPHNEILFINEAAEKILGYEPTQLMGQPLSALFPENLSAASFSAIKPEMMDGGCAEVEARRADGQRIPMELCVSSFRLHNETYFSGVLRDITERKKAMELLKQREQQAALKAEISAILATPQATLSYVLENTSIALKRFLDLAMVRIWTLNAEADGLELQANVGLPHAPVADYQRIRVGEHKIGRVAHARQKYLTNDACQDVFVAYREWAQQEQLTAFAAYPLVVEDQLVGALALFSRRALAPNIFELVDTVAELVAQRIQRQWLDDALVKAHAQLEMRVKERTAALVQANEALQTEIHERRRIEQELHDAQGFLQHVLSNLPHPVFVKDEAGRFTLVNDAFAALYGLSAEQMIGKTDFDFSDEDEARVYRTDDLQVLESRQQKLILEEKHTDYQGQVRWMQTAKRPFSLGPNQPRYLLGITTDLTERKALEDQLRRAQKLKSIGQLAAGIAHEINTPTQYVGDNTRFVLDAYADLKATIHQFCALFDSVRAGQASPEAMAQLERDLEVNVMPLLAEIPIALQQTLEGIERIAGIVRSMKEFSHPGSSEKKAADLNKAIESTITVARNEWKYVAEVETHFDDSLPAVPCLLGEFNQVILNLIVNAAHAIADVVGDGGNDKGKITVTTKKLSPQWAEIRLSDTGSGIPEAIQSRIFDPFFTTKEVGIGTGQGLAISHLVIVEKHQGQLTFETAPGRGTTFIIRLPLEPLANSPNGDSHAQHIICR